MPQNRALEFRAGPYPGIDGIATPSSPTSRRCDPTVLFIFDDFDVENCNNRTHFHQTFHSSATSA